MNVFDLFTRNLFFVSSWAGKGYQKSEKKYFKKKFFEYHRILGYFFSRKKIILDIFFIFKHILFM
jgi:hypothetical protein